MLSDSFSTIALMCTLIPVAAFIAAGSAIAPGISRWPGADMLVGLGLLTGVVSILAVTTRLPLSWLMMGLGVLSTIAVPLLRQVPGGRSTWIALALLSPLLIKATSRQPAAWDDFWNWLPSAAYEYTQNALPWPDLASSHSIFPGYPQGMPLTIAAASFVAGRFLEAAGPVINVALLAGSSALLAEALAAVLVRRGQLQTGEMPLALIAASVSLTVLINPGLDGSVVLSSYADCGTMIAVGALGLLGVEIIARLSTGVPGNVQGMAWRFGFVGAMLVNLKQANPVLLALITGGLILVALRDPALRTTRALLQLPRMLGPAVGIFGLWRWYVTHYLSNAEPSVRPIGAWNFEALPSILSSIGIYITQAPLFHGLMWSVTAVGLVFLFQWRKVPSEARALAMVCCTVWLGYHVFLVIIYIAVMTGNDIYGAGDYWRYTPHVTLLGLYAPVMALTAARWPAWVNPRSAVLTLATILLALCTVPMRGDLNNPSGTAWQRFLRDAAGDMKHLILPGSKAVIVSFSFPDSPPFGVAIRYYLWRPDVREQQIVMNIQWDDRDLARLADPASGNVDYLIIHDVSGRMDGVIDQLGLPRLNRELALFMRRDRNWERVKSWPIPPGLDDV